MRYSVKVLPGVRVYAGQHSRRDPDYVNPLSWLWRIPVGIMAIGMLGAIVWGLIAALAHGG